MDSLEIEEQLARIKKRDLLQTRFYKMASRVFGPAKTRNRVFIAPPMPKRPVCMPKSTNQVPGNNLQCSIKEVFMESKAGDKGSSPSKKDLLLESYDAKHQDWVNQRRSFRRQFDSLGDLSRWVNTKPTVTELEMLVVERGKITQKIPSRIPDYSLIPLQDCKASVRDSVTRPSRQTNIPRMSAVGVRSLLPEDGIPVVQEQLENSVSSLRGIEGKTVDVNDLAEDIRMEERFSWDHRNLPEKGEQGSPLGVDTGGGRDIERVRGRRQWALSPVARRPVWSCGPKSGLGKCGVLPLPSSNCLQIPLSVEDEQEQALIQQHRRNRMKGVIQDEEVLAIMRTVCTGNPIQDAHSNPSSLGGDTAHLVDRFRRQCLGEYLDSLDKCHNKGVNVNQATLERVLLHPGDHVLEGPQCLVLRQAGSKPMPGCGSRLREWIGYSCSTPQGQEGDHGLEEEATPQKVCQQTIRYTSRSSVHQGTKIMTRSTGCAEVKQKTKHWLTGEEYAQMTSNMGGPSSRRADPNAFWPGQDNHVRLYLPRMGLSPEGVLFEHIVHSPAPSPCTWPINNRGYSTSGDIEGHKTYIL
ncbi:uncharacterized protein si:dkey-197j19.5 isoform X2 [Esox lucius]|uniref:uncharacterized protein si:dkey-197j19.5 isoform X2 n=1 Tax=Esox lucius TaxID=8010 RepID=UPI00057698F6|nr:uncharacterized protein si:dkey-197j19.5 isoform X2 [Esox lucius]